MKAVTTFCLATVSLLLTFAPYHARAQRVSPRSGNCLLHRAAHAHSTTDSDSARLSRDVFDRFKRLEGQWVGRSTKGWEESIKFRVIAKGSVVFEDSFDAHPNETMATMFYLDGDRLLLTHYCVAKNQPRLQATSFEDEGRTVTFTFLDATNLPSRDKGHMDKVVYRFADDHHFTSQWTWYQAGKEQWMEEIKYERVAVKTKS